MSPVSGACDDFILPKGLTIFLPKDGAVQAEWVAPPMPESKVRKAGFINQKFLLDSRAAVWMSHNQKVLTNLASGMAFSIGRKINDFVLLDDGAFFIAGDASLGFIPPIRRESLEQTGVPQLPFQPICSLPAESCSLAADGKDGIFAYGRDPADRTFAVFELEKGFAGWRKVFVSGEKISGVCADGKTLYICAGRTIYRMRLGETEASVVFVHPLDFVTGIAYASAAGLFYATPNGIGIVSGAGLEFIKIRNAQIAVKNNMLYVFMPESLGIMRFKNIERLVSNR